MLLAAAETLLATEGLEAVSVRRLAEATATSPRAIYSLFGGMDGLIQGLLGEAFRALAERLDGLATTDDAAADLAAAGVEGFRGWVLERPQLFRLAFGAQPGARPEEAPSRLGVEAFERLVKRASRCEAQGLIAPGSAIVVATAFHALCEGLASLELRGRFAPAPDVELRALWARALHALIAGFGP